MQDVKSWNSYQTSISNFILNATPFLSILKGLNIVLLKCRYCGWKLEGKNDSSTVSYRMHNRLFWQALLLQFLVFLSCLNLMFSFSDKARLHKQLQCHVITVLLNQKNSITARWSWRDLNFLPFDLSQNNTFLVNFYWEPFLPVRVADFLLL